MQPVIEVENLSKVYRVNLSESQHGGTDISTLLAQMVKAPLKRLRHGAGHSTRTEEFWALKDIDFKVYPGEVLGIIGRNGAGKSTLLKILSRITHPTTGKATICGRVGSLLEVGTGFHEELTGRENVYLNGIILGMSRREINRQFDEIVEFAGVERFIDTPVKRYSSGMRVRLGFGVAAFLQPEILIIDEVLAVGDVEFQQRCLGKMNEVAAGGRTVLFVSHNMRAVRQLTNRCLLVDEGRIISNCCTNESVEKYYSLTAGPATGEIDESMHDIQKGVRFLRARFMNLEEEPLNAPPNLTPIHLDLELEVTRRLSTMIVSAGIFTPDDTLLLRIASDENLFTTASVSPGKYRLRLEFSLPLSPGKYVLLLRADEALRHNTQLGLVRRALEFEITTDSQFVGHDQRGRPPLFPCEGRWSQIVPTTPSD